MFLKILTAPLSWIYWLIITIRHKLFDSKILESVEFDIPIICVGNITVGGTGKTPHIEYLIELLSPHYNIAVLSRGYKRKSKGFILLNVSHSTKIVGDEPKQIKLKYPNVVVAVCEKRVDGVNNIRKLHPDVNLILLDDGFQHRRISTWANIILMDYTNPIYTDKMLPLGRLRDLPSRMDKADFVIVTKCPEDIRPIDMRLILKYLNLFPYQSLFFTRMVSSAAQPIYPEYNILPLEDNQKVVVMAAVANPSHFINDMEKRYNVVDVILFDDHHIYKTKDLHTMQAALNKGGDECVIVTTDKDAVKLLGSKKIPESIKRRLYNVPIRVEFIENFENNSEEVFYNKIKVYANQNQRHCIFGSE